MHSDYFVRTRTNTSISEVIQKNHQELVAKHAQAIAEKDRIIAEKDRQIAELYAELGSLNAKVKSDQIVLHKGIEFRRGIKTTGKWMGFCPNCHLPAEDAWLRDRGIKVVICSAGCGWKVFMPSSLQDLIGEIEM